MRGVTDQIGSIQKTAKTYTNIKESIDLKNHELESINKRLAQSTFQQHQTEIDELKAKIETMNACIVESKEIQTTSKRKIRDIEDKLKDAKGYRERELKEAMEAVKEAKKKSEQSQKKWKTREQVSD